MAASNCEGKVVKIKCSRNGKHCEESGIVLSYNRDENKDWVSIRMMRTSGLEWFYSGRNSNIIKITSTRIEKELRAALIRYYNTVKSESIFLEKMKEEQERYRKETASILAFIRGSSGAMDYTEFSAALENMFNANVPRRSAFDQPCYFRLEQIAEGKVFTISHAQHVVKYAKPEQFPFIYREYDQTLHIDTTDKSYKAFCEKNAPALIPALAAKGSVSISASLGDKNTLVVYRDYSFPLKHGMTSKSIEELKERLFG